MFGAMEITARTDVVTGMACRYTGLIGQILGTSPATAKGREAEKVVEFDD